MNKNFKLLTLLSFIFIGCGTSSNDNSKTQETQDSTASLFKELSRYQEIAIIYRSTKDFCMNNNVLETIKNSSDDYKVITGSNPIPECSDFGKTSKHCDTFIADGEPGSITCAYGYNLR